MAELDVLWRPLRIGSLEVSNRVAVASHGTGFAPQPYAEYLAARARGGAGLLFTGAQAVHPSGAIMRAPSAWEPEIVPQLKLAVDAVHREQSALIVQMFHIGAQDPGNGRSDYWGQVQGPSDIPSPQYGITPHIMQPDEVESVIEGFVSTAVHAQEAGADGVEVHGAHGYLLHAFLSPLMNQRTDEYGGSLEKRARIMLDIARRIREACGAELVIGAKLTFDEYSGPAGITPDVAQKITGVLHRAGLFDYFSVSAGNYGGFHRLVVPAISDLSGHTAEYGAMARRAVHEEVPIMVTGSVRSVERAAEIVASGQADIVGMLRAHIADPELVRKARSGRSTEIRRCIGANQGCWRRLAIDGVISCTVNPVVGHEAEWGTTAEIDRAVRRSILVIGGGPAGMKLAETAAQCGHTVTIMEREGVLGGQARFASQLPHRGIWAHMLEDIAGSLDRLGVDVRLNTEVTADAAREFGADAIVVATGASWDIDGRSAHAPTQAGIERSAGAHVIDPITALVDPAACGKRIVIVDETRGYLPFGLAERFAHDGREVTIVTPHMGIGAGLGVSGTSELGWAYPRIVDAGVKVRPYSYIVRVDDSDVLVASVWGEPPVTVAADTVVLAINRTANAALFSELDADGGDVRRIGDCLAPREVDHALFEAVREGHAI